MNTIVEQLRGLLEQLEHAHTELECQGVADSVLRPMEVSIGTLCEALDALERGISWAAAESDVVSLEGV